jgi:hypothetical protein
MNTKFFMADSPAGAGKTHAAIMLSADLATKGHKVIIAQNTTNLMRQTYARLKNHPAKPKVTCLYRKAREAVVPLIENHIATAVPDEGQVLIISHEALLRLNGANRKFWDLIVDEIPNGFVHMPLKIAKTHNIITDHLDVSTQLIDGVSVVKAKNAAAIQAMIENETEDQVIETFSKLLNAITSPDRLVLVDSEKYEDLISNPSTLGHVDFYSVLVDTFARGFNNVTLMGANARETSLFVLWEKLMSVNWQEHPSITNSLLYQTHQNGDRLSIKYLFDRNWSGYFASLDSDESTNLEKVAEFAESYFDGRSYLWHANESVNPELMKSPHRLPSVAHGLDRADYRSTHNVVLLSALNHHPQTYTFLDKLGVDNHTAQTMVSYQAEYQALMRCSLRDPNAIAPVTVMVMSKGSAEWLQSKFPGSTIEKLDPGIAEPAPRGRPKKQARLSDADNTHNSRERKKAREAAFRGEVYVPQLRTIEK